MGLLLVCTLSADEQFPVAAVTAAVMDSLNRFWTSLKYSDTLTGDTLVHVTDGLSPGPWSTDESLNGRTVKVKADEGLFVSEDLAQVEVPLKVVSCETSLFSAPSGTCCESSISLAGSVPPMPLTCSESSMSSLTCSEFPGF